MAAINENGFRNAEPKTGSAEAAKGESKFPSESFYDWWSGGTIAGGVDSPRINEDEAYCIWNAAIEHISGFQTPDGGWAPGECEAAIEVDWLATEEKLAQLAAAKQNAISLRDFYADDSEGRQYFTGIIDGIDKAYSIFHFAHAATGEAEALRAQSQPVEAVAEYVRGYKDGFDGAEDALAEVKAAKAQAALCYKMAKHIRNTEEIAPIPWAVEGGTLLDELQQANPEEYARQVCGSAPSPESSAQAPDPIAAALRAEREAVAAKVEAVREKFRSEGAAAQEEWDKIGNMYYQGHADAFDLAEQMLNSAFPQVPERDGEGK